MKSELELFGASKDFSKKDCLLIEVKDKSSIKDLRHRIIQCHTNSNSCHHWFSRNTVPMKEEA